MWTENTRTQETRTTKPTTKNCWPKNTTTSVWRSRNHAKLLLFLLFSFYFFKQHSQKSVDSYTTARYISQNSKQQHQIVSCTCTLKPKAQMSKKFMSMDQLKKKDEEDEKDGSKQQEYYAGGNDNRGGGGSGMGKGNLHTITQHT